MTALASAPVDAPVSAEGSTVAELLERLGGIAPSRVRYPPAPGTATEQDVIAIRHREKRLYELVEGVLVEKAMGFRKSLLAVVLASLISDVVRKRNLGVVLGADGTFRLMPGLVRIPDVAFISWARMGQRIPSEPIPPLAPDLAVEVLSAGNTPREMARKRREYFQAGVRLLWVIDPDSRTAQVYTAADRGTILGPQDTLDGGEVLGGFTVSLRDLFAELDRQGSPPGS